VIFPTDLIAYAFIGVSLLDTVFGKRVFQYSWIKRFTKVRASQFTSICIVYQTKKACLKPDANLHCSC